MFPITAEKITDALPDADPLVVAEHLGRLDARYFERFPLAEVIEHCAGLSTLDTGRSAAVVVKASAEGRSCTVLAFDHAGAFSLIVGVLASLGLNISSGDIFTWSGRCRARRARGEMRRKRIIDHFTGRCPLAVE